MKKLPRRRQEDTSSDSEEMMEDEKNNSPLSSIDNIDSLLEKVNKENVKVYLILV